MLIYISEYCFRCRKLAFIILLIICVLLYIAIMVKKETEIKSIHISWLKIPPDKVLYFTVDSDNVINLLDERFLSFSIDTSQIYKGLRNPSLKDRSLRKRVRHLGGGYLRVGGNAADMLVFNPSVRSWPERRLPIDGGYCSYEHFDCEQKFVKHRIRKFSMSAEDWHDINDFSKAVDLKLLFDLNVLLRNATTWNNTNAEYLIDYSNAYQYHIDWQLGNEPNSFPHSFGVEVLPEHLARDFNILRKLLNRYSIYNVSKLVGPDTTNPTSKRKQPEVYFDRFLQNGPDINAATWHHYYTGPDTPLEMLLDVSLYNEFTECCRTIASIVKEQAPSKAIWITETGSAYGGGIKDISDRFVASFLWIDKLGVAAREGITLVVRQSLYSGVYALLDSDTLAPTPDYWVSILFHKLVGRKVLRVGCDSCSTSSALRVYGHCSKSSSKIVFYGINLDNATIGLSLPFNTTTSALLYSLTASSLTSREISLNGQKLYLTFTDSLPLLRPIAMSLDSPIPILSHSIFFLEVDVVVPACI